MILSNIKTPLYAAFFCALVLSSCTSHTDKPIDPCSAGTTAIASIQGDGYQSSMIGQSVQVQGVVTHIEDNRGFYIEQSGSDDDPRTSNAVFIETSTPPANLAKGDVIAASGTVAELGSNRDTETALTDTSGLSRCGTAPLPSTDIEMPLKSAARESLEGMRIRINAPLVATDVYQFGRGNITLSANGLQYVATEVMQPGPAAMQYLSNNRDNSIAVNIPKDMIFPELMISGTSVEDITGVLAHDSRGKRVFVQQLSSFTEATFQLPEPPRPGTLRVVGMNLYNYFNGDGMGGGFPTQRGAESIEEFNDQRARIGAAIKVLDPDVVAVQELENDGFGDESAAQDLIRLADASTGHRWQITRPTNDDTGTDAIAVGIFYRADKLEAIGPSQILKGVAFEASRQPQAQLFQRRDNGEKLLVVVNHLKSKGSCPDEGENANQSDGQGCWNPMRRVSAELMSSWANQVAATTQTRNILILGDMNAYRLEEPIQAIRDNGFTELVEAQSNETSYSFAYFGQHGTLDYAFGSTELLNKVENAFIWQVNSILPGNMTLPEGWLRFSDHDPVVVDLR